MLSAMLVASALTGLLTQQFIFALALSLPTTIVGTQLGRRIYKTIGAQRFDRVVLALLALSGVGLVAAALQE
jgi:uncharacterized membrane protein YfcA